jgi:zinc/manganese transport system permease protein
VLLVFSLLIVPAVIGSIFSGKLSVVLLIAWSVGIVASAVGLAGSYALDLPTGAAMVTAQAGFLLLAGLAKVLLFVDSQRRRRNLRIAATSIAAAILVTLLASSVWLMTVPTGDQPLLAVVESATGIGPTQFLRPSERDAYQSATRDALRFQGEVDRLNAMEKAARYQGTPLSDDDIRRIASYQKTFNEMARGERFVQEVLRSKTQVRARWIVGVPGALIAIAGLLWFTRRHWNGHWWGRHRLPGTTQPPASGNSPSRRN